MLALRQHTLLVYVFFFLFSFANPVDDFGFCKTSKRQSGTGYTKSVTKLVNGYVCVCVCVLRDPKARPTR